jgi:hypothetical protein
MSKEIESVAAALFDKIRSRFPGVTLGDEKAKACSDPSEARFFNFTYASGDGAEFGKVTISLINETSLKVYFGQNISSEMDREQRQEWYLFLRNLRQFAKRNLLTFDTRDINKSNLELQDVKQQAKADDVSTTDDVRLSESRLYGRADKPKLSIGKHGDIKILAFHSEKVDEEKRGARSRKIESIFLETPVGERLKLESNNLHGAFAMAEHLNQGGSRDDERGQHITQICREMSALRRFVRLKKNKQFEDNTTKDAVEKAIHDYEQSRKTIKRMSHPKYYLDYFNEFAVQPTQVTDEEIAAVRERFAEKVYDDRIEEALPIIARQMKEINELEEWAEDVYESTWTRPDNADKIKALRELLKTPLPAGIDGIDAMAKIEPIIGDDDLNNAIQNFASPNGPGPDADCRPLIKEWLVRHMPEMLKTLEFGEKNADDGRTNWAQPVSPGADHSAEYADQVGTEGGGGTGWNMTY